MLSRGLALTVVSVQATATGTEWMLARASDGARITLQLSGQLAGAVALGAGSAVLCTALATGWVLSAGGQALAFVPNAIGAALLHNEQLTR